MNSNLYRSLLNRVKNSKYTITLALLFVLFTLPAQAANWVWMGELSDSSQTYVETETIKKVGGKVECWVTINYPKAKFVELTLGTNNKTYLSSVSFQEFDCMNRTVQVLELTHFSGSNRSGESVKTVRANRGEGFSRVIPGSALEAMMMFVCKRSRPK